jgi:hypothetical protein
MTKKKEESKELEVKNTEIKLSETENVDYAWLLRSALRRTPESGATIDMMRKRMPVLDRLEDVEVGDKVEFTIGELNTIKGCVKSMTWGFVDKDLKR